MTAFFAQAKFGLPDPTQAMEIIAHIGEEMKVDISSDSIAQVGELFTALNRNVPNQKLPHYPPPPNASLALSVRLPNPIPL
jgi:hypothetical protein